MTSICLIYYINPYFQFILCFLFNKFTAVIEEEKWKQSKEDVSSWSSNKVPRLTSREVLNLKAHVIFISVKERDQANH